MLGSKSRQSLITAVAIKRPLTPGFKLLLGFVTLLAIAAAAVARATRSVADGGRIKAGQGMVNDLRNTGREANARRRAMPGSAAGAWLQVMP